MRVLAVSLGYDATKWDHPGTHDLEALSYRLIPTRLSVGLVQVLEQVGFSASSWDCCINHYIGNTWQELEQRGVASSYEVLGWNEGTWSDHEFYPETERLFWHELSLDERHAAEQLCFTQELWDEIPIHRWDQVEDAKDHLFSFLFEVSEQSAETIANDLDSPQSRAFLWLTTDYRFFSYSPSRLLQRWVLATFALGLSDSANGRKGTADILDNWVHRRNECHWFSYSPDEMCNDDGLIERIDLRDAGLFGTIPSELGLLSNSLSK